MLRRNPPIRSACDNCHDLKTRCSRDGQSADCQRCLRLELTCSYSASRRMGRPKCNGGGRTQEEPVRITSPRNFPRGFQSATMNNTGIDNAQLGQLGRMSFTASQQASSDEYLRERQLVDSLYAGHPGGGAGMGNSNIQGDPRPGPSPCECQSNRLSNKVIPQKSNPIHSFSMLHPLPPTILEICSPSPRITQRHPYIIALTLNGNLAPKAG